MSLWMRIIFLSRTLQHSAHFCSSSAPSSKREANPIVLFSAYNYEQCTKRLQSAIETITVTHARLEANSAEITSFRAVVKCRHPAFVVRIARERKFSAAIAMQDDERMTQIEVERELGLFRSSSLLDSSSKSNHHRHCFPCLVKDSNF